MRFDLLIPAVVEPKHNNLIYIALALFVGTFAYLLVTRMLISPPGVSIAIFSASSLFVLFPVLAYSKNRDYVLSSDCQWFVLGIAITWAIAIIGFMRRPSNQIPYPTLRWRLVSQRTWLAFFATVCTIDPIITIAKYGKIGLMHGNETMGAGGSHADVMTAATMIGWECGSVAATMLQTDFLVSRENWRYFLFHRRKWIDLAMVLSCLACNSMTGNRFIIVMNVVGFASGLAIFNRLRTVPVLAGMFVLVVFFTVVGNYRIGRADIKEKLAFETHFAFVDSALGWAATYTEPVLPTLDVFLHNSPPPAWGDVWVNAVGPTVLRGVILTKERTSPILELYNLLPHYGYTFRTMYGDLVFDFGHIGSLLVGTGVLFISIILYNKASHSARWLAVFLNTFHMFSFMAFFALFYFLIPFVSLAILLIVSVHAPDEYRSPAVEQPRE